MNSFELYTSLVKGCKILAFRCLHTCRVLLISDSHTKTKDPLSLLFHLSASSFPPPNFLHSFSLPAIQVVPQFRKAFFLNKHSWATKIFTTPSYLFTFWGSGGTFYYSKTFVCGKKFLASTLNQVRNSFIMLNLTPILLLRGYYYQLYQRLKTNIQYFTIY